MAKSPARRLNSLKPNLASLASKRQPHFRQQFILGERCRHDAGEKILRRDQPFAANAFCHHRRIKRRRDQAPFRGRDRHARGCRRTCRACGSDNARCGARRGQAARRAGRARPFCEMRRGARRRRSISILPSSPMRSRPSTSLMSTRCAGLASRNAMIGTRLCPPASTRPSCGATSAKNFQRFVERARHMANERRWLHAANRPALR